MMIDAVMYGMIPSAKTAKELSAPPENRLRNPMAPWVCGLLLQLRHLAEVDARHGDVGAEAVEGDHPEREQHLVPQVRDLQDVLQVGEHAVAPRRQPGTRTGRR